MPSSAYRRSLVFLHRVLIAPRLGKELVSLYQSLTNARHEVAERTAYMRSHWNRTRVQLEVIERIWTSLSEEHQAIQVETLNVLVTKLRSAKNKLTGLLKKRAGPEQPSDDRPAVKRWKYIFVKLYLDDTIKSLDRWQNMYDPSWYLIIRIASSLVDTELKREDRARPAEGAALLNTTIRLRDALRGNAPQAVHIFLPSHGLDGAQTCTIPYSSATYVQRAGTNKGLIVDSVPYVPGSYAGDMDKDIRNFATKLRCADPSTFGVLKCRGVVKLKQSNGGRLASFEIVFETPSPDRPRTLRSCLASRTPHTLTERMDLAKQLARSVNYVHTLDFVHKNIRPENLIGFGDSKLGSYFLTGFAELRSSEGKTYFKGDADWQKNIYRHPERQGLVPEEVYCMQHDIYSLGVCLLEVGLWESFVVYGEDKNVVSPNAALLRMSMDELRRKRPAAIKDMLIDLARRDLSSIMGEVYEEVVVNCLTCLDEDNTDFGDASEFEDADGVSVGVRYIEKVCSVRGHPS